MVLLAAAETVDSYKHESLAAGFRYLDGYRCFLVQSKMFVLYSD